VNERVNENMRQRITVMRNHPDTEILNIPEYLVSI
jgi:transposase-like protein